MTGGMVFARISQNSPEFRVPVNFQRTRLSVKVIKMFQYEVRLVMIFVANPTNPGGFLRRHGAFEMFNMPGKNSTISGLVGGQ